MAEARVDQLYEQHIHPLPVAQRLRLLALLAQDLADEADFLAGAPGHDIMELHGLGKELWEGIDAQAYVTKLRDEWDRRAE